MQTSTDINPKTSSTPDLSAPDVVNVELLRLDQMLEDPNCDHRYVLEQAYKIITLLCNLIKQTHQEYVLDQEPIIYAQVTELKGTYNTWTVLVVTLVSAGAMAGGGLLGIGSAFPGTSLGGAMASFSPNFLSFLSNKDWAETLNALSQGMGGVGQGTGALSKLAENSDEAKRSVCHVLIEELKRKRSDREDASRNLRDQSSGALNHWREVTANSHNIASQLLRGHE